MRAADLFLTFIAASFRHQYALSQSGYQVGLRRKRLLDGDVLKSAMFRGNKAEPGV